MKKTLITLMTLAGVAVAANVSWVGTANDGNWETATNWSGNVVPSAGDKITISGATATVTFDKNAKGDYYNNETVLNVQNSAVVTLGTKAANASRPNANPIFRAQFNIDETSKVVADTPFLCGTNNIFGKLEVLNVCDPAENCTINFGERGIITYASGSSNSVEGNDRTFTIGAVLNTGILSDDATYTLETRYLIQGIKGANNFNPGWWDPLTLAGGRITGTNNLTLTSALDSNPVLTETNKYTTASLTATADDFGKYILGCNASGIYVQYVKSSVVPEPTTATLSLLALAGLAARRRRK